LSIQIFLSQTHTYAYQYCCYLGMQLYRPSNYSELQSVTTTLKRIEKIQYPNIIHKIVIFSVIYGTASAAIGFTKAHNSTHELWCDTNSPIDIYTLLPNAFFPGYTCLNTILMAHLYLPSTSYIRIRELPFTFNTFLCQ
jgi:uncharacterized membrane protein